MVIVIRLRFQVVDHGVTLSIPDIILSCPGQAKDRNDGPPRNTEDKELNLIDRVCPKCNFSQPRRLPRTTWFERRLMPWFGFYPWECPLCRIHFYRKNRIDREHRMHTESSTELVSRGVIH
jgi:hypothetical protein